MDWTLILDFDGTIIKENTWQLMLKKHNLPGSKFHEKYEAAHHKGAPDSELYKIIANWTADDAGKIHAVMTDESLKSVLANMKFTAGFEDFMKSHPKKFGYVAFLSGGFPPLVQKVALRYGVDSYVPQYTVHGSEIKVTHAILGSTKKKLIEGLGRDGRVIYVADDPIKGYESSDYGPNVLRIYMDGEDNPGPTVHNFHELGELVDKIMATPDKYF
ncbi:MAG: hypothetical protein GOV00_03905 [Candidatus Altiarchaeota archaeon]|nr:hypothetical protein [Candidatus Altiarchaeota archaeon]